jgi:hypothetical protein
MEALERGINGIDYRGLMGPGNEGMTRVDGCQGLPPEGTRAG